MASKIAKVVLVTGASSGIGRATADRLHGSGHIVYGTSRDPDRHAAPLWRMIALDVCDDASVTAAVDRVLAEQGHIDALINNAGLVLAGAVEDTTPAEALNLLDTNVLGALRLARAVLPSMRGRRSGTIVNMGSLAGRVGLPFQGFYSASKFAIEGLTESLRLELAGSGVAVALVVPGDSATGVVANRMRAAGSRDPVSAYRIDCDRILASYEKDELSGIAPDRVAAVIATLVEGVSRGPRHVIGHLGQRAIIGSRALVPTRPFQWLMRRFYGLQG